MGLDVAAVARVEPNAGAATGAAEPKPVLWPKRAMVAEADESPNPWKEEFDYLDENIHGNVNTEFYIKFVLMFSCSYHKQNEKH